MGQDEHSVGWHPACLCGSLSSLEALPGQNSTGQQARERQAAPAWGDSTDGTWTRWAWHGQGCIQRRARLWSCYLERESPGAHQGWCHGRAALHQGSGGARAGQVPRWVFLSIGWCLKTETLWTVFTGGAVRGGRPVSAWLLCLQGGTREPGSTGWRLGGRLTASG